MNEDYLTFDRYREICRENRETDAQAQEVLAFYLHSLGIALNYREDFRLRDTHVLNPQWVTEGIYRILNHDKIKAQKGELRLSDLAQILNSQEYPPERHALLLELMRKFELCFRFPDQDEQYLIPQLLDKEQPAETDAFVPEHCLNFEYHYPVLPEGLLPRFIVRTCVQSVDQPRWRSGVILNLERNSALVAANTLDKRVRIAVTGPKPGRRRLLAVIRSDFERIHGNYKFQPKEMVPVPGHPDVLIPYADLKVLEDAGKMDYLKVVDDGVLELNVEELLDGVDLDGTRRTALRAERPNSVVRAFVSYSHKDETLRAELETQLKLLKRRRILDLWQDRRISAGTEWKGQIDDNLERSDLILLLVSADFIASDYCYDIEMRRAMERHEKGAARVIPIIVREVSWHSAPFGRLQALPTDDRAVARNSKFARDKAWRIVASGIEQVIEELRATA